MSKIPVTTILLIVLAIVLTLQFKSCFTKADKPAEMIRNEEKIKYLEAQRLQDSIRFVEKLALIDSFVSLSEARYTELENRKQPIKNAIKKEPGIVDNFDKQQLSRAITDFFLSQ